MDRVRYSGRPIYFLVLMAGIWSVPRLYLLQAGHAPGAAVAAPQPADPLPARSLAMQDPVRAAGGQRLMPLPPPAPASEMPLPMAPVPPAATPIRSRPAPAKALPGSASVLAPAVSDSPVAAPALPPAAPEPRPTPPLPVPEPALLADGQEDDRWRGYAWMFVRGAGKAGVAPGGQYGGSQAGISIARPLDDARRLSAYVRASRALAAREAEAAVGIRLQPDARVPVAVHVEQRQALDSGPRRGTALFLTGGVEQPVAASFVAEGYWQAGYVGGAYATPFLESAASATRPVAGIAGARVGVGMWTGAQRGAARMDMGPRAEWRQGRARLAADWRFRLAGKAQPGSGPAFTLSTEF